MTGLTAALRARIRLRAGLHCEYCLLHEDDGLVPHEPDHVLAVKHGGRTTEENLAYACFLCNRHKGSDIASIDPLTGAITPLFNPRSQTWETHFSVTGVRIEPLTPEGRATVNLLQLNHPDRLAERRLLRRVSRWPAP